MVIFASCKKDKKQKQKTKVEAKHRPRAKRRVKSHKGDCNMKTQNYLCEK